MEANHPVKPLYVELISHSYYSNTNTTDCKQNQLKEDFSSQSIKFDNLVAKSSILTSSLTTMAKKVHLCLAGSAIIYGEFTIYVHYFPTFQRPNLPQAFYGFGIFVVIKMYMPT
uniref:Uncharacterized protein n=1 Tax=Glossina palpalis gambiensis TaxID=67801 RepID=A0A1B0C4Q1_9MUSC